MASKQRHFTDRVHAKLHDPIVVGIIEALVQNYRASLEQAQARVVVFCLLMLGVVGLSFWADLAISPAPPLWFRYLTIFGAGYGLGSLVMSYLMREVTHSILRKRPAVK